MAMTRQAKEEMVGNLTDMLDKARAGLVFNYQGLSVEQVTDIRRRFREADVHYQVVKNTLMKIALNGRPVEGLSEQFKGTTAIAVKFDDEYGKLGKTAKDLAKEYEKLEPKGGFVEEDVIGDDKALDVLASLPTLDEARSQLLGVLNAPASKLLAQLNAPASQLLAVFEAKIEKDKEEA